MAYCPKCNSEMGTTEIKCPKCGFDFPEEVTPRPLYKYFVPTTLSGTAITIFFLFIIFISVFPGFFCSVNEVSEKALRGSCQNNLMNIGLDLYMYAKDNDGYFPLSLNDPSASEYLSKNPDVFFCPSDFPYSEYRKFPLNSEKMGYKYKGAGCHVNDEPAKIILIDKKMHTKPRGWKIDEGWNVLTSDLKVYFISSKERKLIYSIRK